MFHLCKHQHHRRQHHHQQHHHHDHHNHNYHRYHNRWTQGSANGWTTRSVCALFVTSRLARRWPTGLSMYILYMYCFQCISLYGFCWSIYIPKYLHNVGEEVTNRFIDVHCTCIVFSVYLYMFFVDQCIFQSTCTWLASGWPTGLSMYIL